MSLYKGLFLLLFLFSSSTYAIRGGQPFDLNEAPFHISYRAFLECSGTVIGRHHILTAAHCFDNGRSIENFDKISVSDGRRRTLPLVSVSINGYEPGFAFNPEMSEVRKDIAIIYTRTNLFKVFKIESLPFVLGSPLNKQEVWNLEFSGFSPIVEGSTIELSTASAMPVQPSPPGVIKAIFLKEGISTCNGDSGGPTWLKTSEATYLIGVNSVRSSQTSQCGERNSIAASALLDEHLCWISERVPDAPIPEEIKSKCP